MTISGASTHDPRERPLPSTPHDLQRTHRPFTFTPSAGTCLGMGWKEAADRWTERYYRADAAYGVLLIVALVVVGVVFLAKEL